MISLEGISDSEGDVSATLALMAKVIRRVQVEVLRARFGDFAKRLDSIISLYQESGNGSLLVNVRQICVFLNMHVSFYYDLFKSLYLYLIMECDLQWE